MVHIASANNDENDGIASAADPMDLQMLQSKMSIATNVITRRKEQLKQWEVSDMNQLAPTRRDQLKVKFQDSDVFLSACVSGDTEEVDDLLNKGANIDTTTIDGVTALHQAVIDGNIDTIEFLLDRNANIDAQDNEGWTPLHAAVCCSSLPIVKILCERGADLACVNFDKELAVDLAEDASIKQYLEEQMLLQNINQKDCRDREYNLMMQDCVEWVRSGKFLDQPHNDTGATALHVASSKGYNQLIGMLIRAGADAHAKDFEGWTPLHAAAHWGEKDSCRILIENGARITDKNYADQDVISVADSSIVEYIQQISASTLVKSVVVPSVQKSASSPSNTPWLAHLKTGASLSNVNRNINNFNKQHSPSAHIPQTPPNSFRPPSVSRPIQPSPSYQKYSAQIRSQGSWQTPPTQPVPQTESEAERKAKSKQQRATRRSTRGVSAEDIAEARASSSTETTPTRTTSEIRASSSTETTPIKTTSELRATEITPPRITAEPRAASSTETTPIRTTFEPRAASSTETTPIRINAEPRAASSAETSPIRTASEPRVVGTPEDFSKWRSTTLQQTAVHNSAGAASLISPTSKRSENESTLDTTFNRAPGHLSIAAPVSASLTPSASRLRKSQIVLGNRRGTGPVDKEALSAAKEANKISSEPPQSTDFATKYPNVTVRTPRNQTKTYQESLQYGGGGASTAYPPVASNQRIVSSGVASVSSNLNGSTPQQSNGQSNDFYKQLYEKEKNENDKLRKKIDEMNTKSSENLSNGIPRTPPRAPTIDDEKKAYERKIQQLEYELEKTKQLQSDFKRLKDENGALIRGADFNLAEMRLKSTFRQERQLIKE